MGALNHPLAALVPAAAATLLALAFGAAWPGVVAAVLLWTAAALLPTRHAVWPLATAPIVLAAASPLPSLLHLGVLLWIPIALAAVAPLPLRLAGRFPTHPGLLMPLLALPLALLPIALPWASAYYASDLATRVHIVLLALAALLVTSLATTLEAAGEDRGTAPTPKDPKPTTRRRRTPRPDPNP